MSQAIAMRGPAGLARAIFAPARVATLRAVKWLTRLIVLQPLFFVPMARRIAIERWLRGREEHGKLRKADCIVVSFGKSGRTWLRVMLSQFYRTRHGLAVRHLVGFDHYHLWDRAVPRLFFTHDNYLKDYTSNNVSKKDYYGKKVILLVRNPADVSVSQYHQWRYRMPSNKKALNDYPPDGEEVAIFEFVAHHQAGLAKVIDFMNGWAREMPRLHDLLMVRYEDMRAHPEQALGQILAFIGTPGTEAEIREAVAFASFENMQRLERQGAFRGTGGHLVPNDPGNTASFKVRRGKVGGYRNDFSAEQVAQIEARMRDCLSPAFGYTAPADP